MRCPRCGSVTAVSHSEMHTGARYRRRYCTTLECRHAFSTWESTESPAAIVRRVRAELKAGLVAEFDAARHALREARQPIEPRRPQTEDEKRAVRRICDARRRAADPERYKAKARYWRLRQQARAEAAATGEPVEAIYARWNVL